MKVLLVDADYSIYPDNNISYGFITRGCIRNCSFCKVPKKEGYIHQENNITDMVQKVGDRRYWEQWAKDVAVIAERQIERITHLIENREDQKEAFESFLDGLRKNINPSITQTQAVEMLAQHIITKPIKEHYRMKAASQAHRTTAAIWFRFAPPKLSSKGMS